MKTRILILCALLWTACAHAASSVTYTGTQGANTASVTFTLTNEGALLVTLTNTSAQAATSIADVLTGFYFSSTMSVRGVGAAVAPGSVIGNCAACPAGVSDIGGEWFWKGGVTGFAGPEASNVFAASSLGFLTDNLGYAVMPGARSGNGVDFGLVSNATSFGQAVFTGSPLIRQSVVVVMQMGGAFSLTGLSGVGFLWGTGLLTPDDWDVTKAKTPEPGTGAMALAGVAAVVLAAVVLAPRRERSAP